MANCVIPDTDKAAELLREMIRFDPDEDADDLPSDYEVETLNVYNNPGSGIRIEEIEDGGMNQSGGGMVAGGGVTIQAGDDDPAFSSSLGELLVIDIRLPSVEWV